MIAQPKLYDILDKAVAGERLDPEEGLRLLESSDLTALGRAANEVSRRMHPEPYRTYNIDRNINYTNICTAVCDFLRILPHPKILRRLRASAGGASRKNPRNRRTRWRANLATGWPASRI